MLTFPGESGHGQEQEMGMTAANQRQKRFGVSNPPPISFSASCVSLPSPPSRAVVTFFWQ